MNAREKLLERALMDLFNAVSVITHRNRSGGIVSAFKEGADLAPYINKQIHAAWAVLDRERYTRFLADEIDKTFQRPKRKPTKKASRKRP